MQSIHRRLVLLSIHGFHRERSRGACSLVDASRQEWGWAQPVKSFAARTVTSMPADPGALAALLATSQVYDALAARKTKLYDALAEKKRRAAAHLKAAAGSGEEAALASTASASVARGGDGFEVEGSDGSDLAVPVSVCPSSFPAGVNGAAVAALRTRLRDLLETCEEAQWLDDGDFTLQRFLDSRGGDLGAAEAMFRATVQWRTDHDVRGELARWQAMEATAAPTANESAYTQGCDESGGGQGVRRERALGMRRERALGMRHGYAARLGYCGGGGGGGGAAAVGDRGSSPPPLSPLSGETATHAVPSSVAPFVPLNVERVGAYDVAGCVAVPGMVDVVAKAYIMYLEETFQAVREASLRHNTYVRSAVVSDASGLGWAHLKHASLMRDVVGVGTAHYPEVVGTVLVVQAPPSMHTLWHCGVKHLLSGSAQAKVKLLVSEPHTAERAKAAGSGSGSNGGGSGGCDAALHAALREMRIDPAQLPPFLGGTVPCAALAQPVPRDCTPPPPVRRFGRRAGSTPAPPAPAPAPRSAHDAAGSGVAPPVVAVAKEEDGGVVVEELAEEENANEALFVA